MFPKRDDKPKKAGERKRLLIQFTDTAGSDSREQARLLCKSTAYCSPFKPIASLILFNLLKSHFLLTCICDLFYIIPRIHTTQQLAPSKMDTTDYFQRYQQVSSLEKSKNALIEVGLAFGLYQTRTFLNRTLFYRTSYNA